MEERSIASYNHGDALLTYLHQLQQEQRFTDVVIQCQGEVVSLCHRLILAAFSGHFETALAGVETSAQITLDIDPKITGTLIFSLELIRRTEIVRSGFDYVQYGCVSHDHGNSCSVFFPGVSIDDLKRIVEFFYTGRVQVSPTLHKSAEALGASTLAAVLEAAPEAAELLEDTEHGVHLVEACRRFYLESRFCDVIIRCQVSSHFC